MSVNVVHPNGHIEIVHFEYSDTTTSFLKKCPYPHLIKEFKYIDPDLSLSETGISEGDYIHLIELVLCKINWRKHYSKTVEVDIEDLSNKVGLSTIVPDIRSIEKIYDDASHTFYTINTIYTMIISKLENEIFIYNKSNTSSTGIDCPVCNKRIICPLLSHTVMIKAGMIDNGHFDCASD